MSTVALLQVALVLGWLGALSLARDVARMELTDFMIAASGALLASWLMPRLGFEVWGEYGPRLSTHLSMAVAAVLTLILANLVRGRGLLCTGAHSFSKRLQDSSPNN
jgi:uncharacterized membrane protein YeaQ/YmgE (transglycosylase-associated protein family)